VEGGEGEVGGGGGEGGCGELWEDGVVALGVQGDRAGREQGRLGRNRLGSQVGVSGLGKGICVPVLGLGKSGWQQISGNTSRQSRHFSGLASLPSPYEH